MILQFYFRVRVLGHFSCVLLFAALWTVACQAPLSMGLSRQEYWSGLPCPPAGDLADSGLKFHLSCTEGGFFTGMSPEKPSSVHITKKFESRYSNRYLYTSVHRCEKIPWSR